MESLQYIFLGGLEWSGSAGIFDHLAEWHVLNCLATSLAPTFVPLISGFKHHLPTSCYIFGFNSPAVASFALQLLHSPGMPLAAELRQHLHALGGGFVRTHGPHGG